MTIKTTGAEWSAFISDTATWSNGELVWPTGAYMDDVAFEDASGNTHDDDSLFAQGESFKLV